MPIQRIILIGFRATGKSAVGKKLAEKIGYRFVDTDQILQDKLGCSISSFVDNNGWNSFRKHEAELLVELSNKSAIVVATGGGAVENRSAFQGFCENGFVVWLTAEKSTIFNRMQSDNKSQGQRPPLTSDNAIDEITKLLIRRTPLYQDHAQLQLATDRATIEQLCNQIEENLNNIRVQQDITYGRQHFRQTV